MSSTRIFDRELLIAEYTLGLLNSHESSQAQQLLGEDAQAAAVALKWENNFLDLVDLLPPVNPGPQSLQRLQATLGHAPKPAAKPISTFSAAETAAPAAAGSQAPRHAAAQAVGSLKNTEQETFTVAAALRTREKSAEQRRDETLVPAPVAANSNTAATTKSSTTPTIKPNAKSAIKTAPAKKTGPESGHETKKGNIWIWRIASAVFASIAIVLGLMPSEPAAPPITVVEIAPTMAAIMQAPGQSSTPGWVVTVDPQGNVLMNPLVRSDIPADASVQLWTYNKTMTQPRSLGLIDVNQPVTVPATLMGQIGPDQIFEMTQEAAGGSPTASPSGPILFIGRIVTFGRTAVNPPVDALAPDQ